MIMMIQPCKLERKPSGGERAWFLEEESEPRNKGIFLAGENHRADVTAYKAGLQINKVWGNAQCITL
jgi:hypothetical protein